MPALLLGAMVLVPLASRTQSKPAAAELMTRRTTAASQHVIIFVVFDASW